MMMQVHPRRRRLSSMTVSVAEARAAYFERVDDLEARGYLDGTAG